MTDRMLMISADSHAAMPIEILPDYLEKAYHGWLEKLRSENDEILELQRKAQIYSDDVIDVIDGDRRLRSGGREGSFDLSRRLAEMDHEGIACEVIFQGSAEATPPFFSAVNQPYPADVRSAGERAYNRWLGDQLHEADGRLTAIAGVGPWHDMEATLQEVHWAADHGFRGITPPCSIADVSAPPIFDPYYEPFWQTCAERDLVISLHAGHGFAQGTVIEFFRKLMKESRSEDEALAKMAAGVEGSPFAPTVAPTQVLYSLMLAGIFDRYPDLHFSLTEVRSDWVPATLELLDRRFERGDTPLEKRPSEYWSKQCFVGASSIKKSEVRLRDEIGTSRMMFGRDYPHAEGTWPNTWDWLRDALADYSEVDARALLGENAAHCYRLDEVALRAVADRIGPRSEDLLGGSPSVDARLVESFAQRAGYEKSYEVIEAKEIEQLFDRDLAAVSEAAVR